MPTQNSDVSGNPAGITYSAAGETWKVSKGVDVFGSTAGVLSDYANSKLVNKGSLFGNGYGVLFDAGGLTGNLTIYNKASGSINGGFGVLAVDFLGSLDFQNMGDVSGNTVGAYLVGSSDIHVANEGDIFGGTYGIFAEVTTVSANGPVIDNNGTVKSALFGIYIGSITGVLTKITNHEDGLIKGSVISILSGEQLKLKNEGKIDGVVVTNTYDDKIINKGNIKGDLLLGAGVDTFKNKGKAKAGLIDTQDGNDVVVLGDKADKLLFDSALNAATNVDSIKKFESGKDMIYLDTDIFTALSPGVLPSSQFHKGTSAADADDHIIYDKPSGALYYDQDGSGAIAQVKFAEFEAGTKLKASDFTAGEYSILI